MRTKMTTMASPCFRCGAIPRSSTAFYDEHAKARSHERALSEIVRLERDPQSGRIDHSPNFSKDCADAVAGVVYGLTYRRETWTRHGVPINQKLITLVCANEDKEKLETGHRQRMH